MIRKVYISPSTQEKNVGVGTYGTEEQMMNKLADIVVPLLQYNDCVVRRNKPEMTLSQAIADSDTWKPDIHVALHSNAMGGTSSGKARGCEVWCYMTKGPITNSQKLAQAIYEEVSAITPTVDRGIKDGVTANLGEVKNVDATSCILEIAFHDNLEDSIWIQNNLPAIAAAIVRGICKYYGVPFKQPEAVNPWEIKYKELIGKMNTLLQEYKEGVK